MSNFEPLSKAQLKIFGVAELHQTYWKEFCDACYGHFGFETNEIRTYEQKYETFCRCKCFITEEDGYEEKLLAVTEEDLRQLKNLQDWFYTLNESVDIIPTLYMFIRRIWTIKAKLKNDCQLISYICPRCKNIDYNQYLLNDNYRFTQKAVNWQSIKEVIKNSTDYALLKEMMNKEAFDKYTEDFEHLEEPENGISFMYNPVEESISTIVDLILEEQISTFNFELKELIAVLPKSNDCPNGSELKAFLFRLFMSYEESLSEIKLMLEEYPSPLNFVEMQKERNNLIQKFSETNLGKHWIQWMEYKDGIKHVAHYFMRHRNDFTEKEERDFFFTLDKIAIINDILMGECKKYWLEIEYPDEWFTMETTDNIEVTSDNAVIPQNCTEAIVKVMEPKFTLTNKVVMNSRKQIVKAASVIDLTTNVQVALLMAIGIEVKAIRPGTKCIDFIRALIGIGVIKYSDEKAIKNMADGMNRKLHGTKKKNKKVLPLPPKHIQWKEIDKTIGDAIYKAMTTEKL
ncbi:hypothetical protein DW079_00495 [Segatella copri]|uniref:Uncharacterized protein n=1 Tax=Segatella copri TaxID=165179 RepID=A0A3R6MFM2_9BACT|nr:hypothetical protein DW079_00495 [Segatella copri]